MKRSLPPPDSSPSPNSLPPPHSLPPPGSELELIERARSIAGRTFGELAARAGVSVPPDLRRAKGWAGTLLERFLGATAKSRACPDFEALGIELKTIPVDRTGKPLETTFVCTIPLLDVGGQEWRSSRVWEKLQRVLWVPVMGERSLPVAERCVGTAILWSPSAEEEADLRWDWEELSGRIGSGNSDALTGHAGHFLQVRPKAANGQARRRAVDQDGVVVEVLPRGFYLRPAFTERILRQLRACPR